jgi:hypothetical protein
LLLLLVVVFVVVLFVEFEENIIECSESVVFVRFETRRRTTTTVVRFATRAAMERRKEGKILSRGGEILKRHG